MSRFRGKQALLIKPLIEATKNVIRRRLLGEQDIEDYLMYYKDYFSIKGCDVKCNEYSNVTSALNNVCKNRIYVNGEISFLLEKVRGGKGSYCSYVLPKEQILKLIGEVKEENSLHPI